jgi:hypothetical protein
LLVIIDELGALCDRLPNAKSRERNFAKLHTIVDESFQGRAPGLGFLIAGTNEAIEDPDTGLFSYPPLRSRLKPATDTAEITRFSSIIPLSPLSPEEIYLLLHNIMRVQALGDPEKFLVSEEGIQRFLELSAGRSSQTRAANPRDIVRPFVDLLARLEANPKTSWADLLKNHFARRVN